MLVLFGILIPLSITATRAVLNRPRIAPKVPAKLVALEVKPEKIVDKPKPVEVVATTTEVATTTVEILPPTPQQILEKLRSSVVYVESYNEYGTNRGSGTIIYATSTDSTVYVLTTSENVSGANVARVYLTPDLYFIGPVVGRDEYIGLAVIKIFADNLTAATFDDSKKAYLGDTVFALGYSSGIVKDIDFNDGAIIQRPGDYLRPSLKIPSAKGGPLVNMLGNVVAINTENGFLTSNIVIDWIPELEAGRQARMYNEHGGAELEAINNLTRFNQLLSEKGQLYARLKNIYNESTYMYDINHLDGVLDRVAYGYKDLLDPLILLKNETTELNAYTVGVYNVQYLSDYHQKKISELSSTTVNFIAWFNTAIEKVKGKVDTVQSSDPKQAVQDLYDLRSEVEAKRAYLVDSIEFILASL